MEMTLNFLSDNVIYATGWTMLHSLWQAPAIAFTLWLALKSRPAYSARRRYALAYAALALVLLAGIVTFGWYYTPETEGIAQVLANEAPVPAAIAEMAAPDVWERFSFWIDAHLHQMVGLWGLGLAFFLTRLSAGWLYAQNLRLRHAKPASEAVQQWALHIAAHLGLRRKVKVLETALLQIPATIGWLKPVILLPLGMANQLTPQEVEAILAHELAHIRRHDYLLNLLQNIIESLLYFNPAVWYISAIIRREREHSCDDLAVQVCGSSLIYAKALVQIQELNRPAPRLAMALFRKKGALLLRIQRILQPTIQPTSDIMEKITVTGLLLAAVLAFTVRTTSMAAPSESLELPAVFAIDSLPAGKITIKTVENGEKMEARIEDRKLVYLRLNDREIPQSELAKYEGMVEKKMSETPPPPPPPPAPGMTPPPPPAPPVPGMKQKSITIEMDGNGPGKMVERQKNVTVTVGDDGKTIISTEEGNGEKKITRTRITQPEMTIIEGNDTIVIFSPDGKEMLRPKIEMDGRSMERQEIQMRVLERNMERQARDMERQAHEMDKNAQEMERSFEFRIDPSKPEWRELREAGGEVIRLLGGGKGTIRSVFERELMNDGLISEPGGYKLELTANAMKVNGKKVPSGMADKYRDIYEEHTGISWGKGGKIVIER
ncbi:MAG: M56 family metallopeptidase [Saprospiraceae bacterium]|nr:M56 family metallopeptidase [Saprospiraceae bacterium]